MSKIDIAANSCDHWPMTLNVSLTPHLEDFIHQTVGSGRYQSVSEVVRTALRLLEDQERERALRHDALKRAIQQGIDSGPAEILDIDALMRECHAEFDGKTA